MINNELKRCIIGFYNIIISNRIQCYPEYCGSYQMMNFRVPVTDSRQFFGYIRFMFEEDLIIVTDEKFNRVNELRYNNFENFKNYLNKLISSGVLLKLSNNSIYQKEFYIIFGIIKHILSNEKDEIFIDNARNEKALLNFEFCPSFDNYGVIDFSHKIVTPDYYFNPRTRKEEKPKFIFTVKLFVDEYNSCSILKIINEGTRRETVMQISEFNYISDVSDILQKMILETVYF